MSKKCKKKKDLYKITYNYNWSDFLPSADRFQITYIIYVPEPIGIRHFWSLVPSIHIFKQNIYIFHE